MLGDVKKWLIGFIALSLSWGCMHSQTAPIPENQAQAEDHDAGVVEEEPPAPEVEIPLREEEIDAGTPEEQEEVEEVSLPTPPPPPPAPRYSSSDVKLAKGIFKLKMKNHRGIWWECGERYETQEEIQEAALEWAKAINEAHGNTEYKLRSGVRVRVPVKEAVGIMISESKFDRCAVGPHPRKFAYKKKILKRPPNNISHSLEEIRKVVEHPAFRGRKADIGVGQIVKKLGKGHMEWDDVLPFLTVVPGVQKVFDEMAYRGEFYNTRYPSLHWPGSQKHKWYRMKVLRLGIPVFGQLILRSDG